MNKQLVKNSPIARKYGEITPLAQEQLDYLLLDGSGSMLGETWNRSCAAIDAYVAELKVQHVKSHLTLHVFDDNDMELIWRDCGIDEFKFIYEDPIGAHWGGTPLYDAINLLGRRLRDINPTKAAITILTDGGEAGSRYTDEVQARAIIRWMEAKGWQVTFIGCEFANHKLAERLGCRPEQAIGVQRLHLTSAAQSLAKKRGNYARTGAPMHWTEAEQQQFGGYLAPPKMEK